MKSFNQHSKSKVDQHTLSNVKALTPSPCYIFTCCIIIHSPKSYHCWWFKPVIFNSGTESLSPERLLPNHIYPLMYYNNYMYYTETNVNMGICLISQWLWWKHLITTNSSKVNPLKELLADKMPLHLGRPKVTCLVHAFRHSPTPFCKENGR